MDRDHQGHEHTAAWPVERRDELTSDASALGRQPIALDVLALLGCAALLLDESGTITGANALAERLLGSDLDVRACQLVASNRASNDLLQDLLRTALKRMPLSYSMLLPPILIQRREGRPIVVQVLPAAGLAGALGEGTRAILLLTDLETQPQLPESRLMLLFGLTPAEARLAARLGTGETLEAAASALQVSLGTARNQLKAVFAKTQTNRQAELIALLCRTSDLAVSTSRLD
jgi:DNA-binding CsgD family transcriptional regulator